MIAFATALAMIFAVSSCGEAATTPSGNNNSSTSQEGNGNANSGDGNGAANGSTNGSNTGANGSTSGTTGGGSTTGTGTGGGGTGSTGGTSTGGSEQAGGNVAYFTNSGSIAVQLASVSAGSGTQIFDIQELRDDAASKNANLSTMLVSDLAVSINPASVSALAGAANTTFILDIYYQLPGAEKVKVGHTSKMEPITIADLIAGVSMKSNVVMQTPELLEFPQVITNANNNSMGIVVEVHTINPALVTTSNFTIDYTISANAQVRL